MIDYCKLNLITKKDSYPLPRIDNTLDRLGHAKYFSAMDLISGYWQVEIPESEQEKRYHYVLRTVPANAYATRAL